MPMPNSTPLQLSRIVFGLNGAKPGLFTLADSDPQLMAMDAPEVIPAGSTARREVLPERDYFQAWETTVWRMPLFFNGRYYG